MSGTEMIIKQEGGKVIQRFAAPLLYVEYDAQNAIDVAMALTDAAFEARDGVKPASASLKSELVERHRMNLTRRVALMLGTLRGDKLKSDGQIARDVVEACLKEIF